MTKSGSENHALKMTDGVHHRKESWGIKKTIQQQEYVADHTNPSSMKHTTWHAYSKLQYYCPIYQYSEL